MYLGSRKGEGLAWSRGVSPFTVSLSGVPIRGVYPSKTPIGETGLNYENATDLPLFGCLMCSDRVPLAYNNF